MLKLVLAGAAIALAAPAIASDRAHNPLQVSEALKAGCKVHQVHVPAGKIATQPAIVRCEAPVREAARNGVGAKGE
jgi:predicted secreted protein